MDPILEVEKLREENEMFRATVEIMRLNTQLLEEEVKQLTAHLESELQSHNREQQCDSE